MPLGIWRRYEQFWLSSVDCRIYELLRIAFGAVAFLNLACLWPVRHLLFSSNGIVDSRLNRLRYSQSQSLFWYWNSHFGVTTIMAIAAVACVFVCIGFLTRPSILLVMLWSVSSAVSLDTANTGWDLALLAINLQLLLSPIGQRWCLDARLRKRKVRDRVPVFGLRLIQIQVTIIYLQAVFYKMMDMDWQRGYSVAYFFMSSYSNFQSPIWMEYHWLSPVLTYSAMSLELLLPFFLWQRRFRFAGFFLGYCFHAAIATSSVFLFSLVMMVGYLAFLDDSNLTYLISLIHEWRGQPRFSWRAAKANDP